MPARKADQDDRRELRLRIAQEREHRVELEVTVEALRLHNAKHVRRHERMLRELQQRDENTREASELRRELEVAQRQAEKLGNDMVRRAEAHDKEVQRLREKHSAAIMDMQERHAAQITQVGQRYESMLSTNVNEGPRMRVMLTKIISYARGTGDVPGIGDRSGYDRAHFVLNAIANIASIALNPVPDMSQMGKPNGS